MYNSSLTHFLIIIVFCTGSSKTISIMIRLVDSHGQSRISFFFLSEEKCINVLPFSTTDFTSCCRSLRVNCSCRMPKKLYFQPSGLPELIFVSSEKFTRLHFFHWIRRMQNAKRCFLWRSVTGCFSVELYSVSYDPSFHCQLICWFPSQ